jgi:rsbT co-antagonist protein RsbR
MQDQQLLMRSMGLTDQAIERRKKYVGLTGDDIRRITAVRDVVTRNVDQFVAAFFDSIAGLEEARTLMGNRDALNQARGMKRDHLLAMVAGEYGPSYVEQRLQLGVLYNKVALDTKVFLGAFHHALRTIGTTILRDNERHPLEAFENFMSLKKVAFFDIGLIVDTVVYERERTIRQQSEAIRELSTPVLQVRERMLLLPIIGVIDTHRAQLITENLLRAIRGNRARVVVMDVTGVATIDSKVANHLLQTVAAARLMGANVIVTGLSAEVAQSLVALGIELTKFNAVGDLQGGIEEAEHQLGYRGSNAVAPAAHPE